MENNNGSQYLGNILKSAIESTINYYRNHPTTRQIIQDRLTKKEVAELSLVFEGECEMSKETIQKTDAIWLEILEAIDPALCEYERSRQKK